MAKLVAVCRSDDYPFERRQIPLVVDDNLTMVLQFNDTCLGCDMIGIQQKELDRFVQRFSALNKDEVAVALMATNKEIFNLLSQMVPCVGCRRSVEKLFGQLTETNYPALDPLIITKTSVLSISRNYLFDPKAIYALFYVHGSKLNTMMDAIPKSKKNKRCVLHSLETHKSKSTSNWEETWDLLSQDCREEVVLIGTDSLMETLDSYLRKHRFCTECKAKVLKAYSILVKDIDGTKEKGYCPALYEGLRCCRDQRHIHIPCKTEYISSLVCRAEPELLGSRRERHAKTLDVAQEEVLTCVGIHIFDRVFKIAQKVKSEEQTWQILFYLGVDALKKNFEMAMEKKQGISNLELICEELLEEERAREQKKEQKRQKKKKKKSKTASIDEEKDKENCNKEFCRCAANNHCSSGSCEVCRRHVNAEPKVVIKTCSCDDHSLRKLTTNSPCSCSNQSAANNEKAQRSYVSTSDLCHNLSSCKSECTCDSMNVKSSWCSMVSKQHTNSDQCDCNDNIQDTKLEHQHLSTCKCEIVPQIGLRLGLKGSPCDHGYSSGIEGCETCSVPSSSGSDVACYACEHSHSEGIDICSDCLTDDSSGKASPKHKCRQYLPNSAKHTALDSPGVGVPLSLEDMLEDSCSSCEDEDLISEEDIKLFRANQDALTTKRQELRETLRQRFNNMQQRGTPGGGGSLTADDDTEIEH